MSLKSILKLIPATSATSMNSNIVALYKNLRLKTIVKSTLVFQSLEVLIWSHTQQSTMMVKLVRIQNPTKKPKRQELKNCVLFYLNNYQNTINKDHLNSHNSNNNKYHHHLHLNLHNNSNNNNSNNKNHLSRANKSSNKNNNLNLNE